MFFEYVCLSTAHNLFATSALRAPALPNRKYRASVKRAALTVEHRLPWFLLNFARDDLFQQSRLLPVARKISSKGNTAAVSSWAERRWLRFYAHLLSEIDLFAMRFYLLCSVLWWFFMAGAPDSGKLRFLHLQTYFIDCGVCAGVIHKQVLVLVVCRADEWLQ